MTKLLAIAVLCTFFACSKSGREDKDREAPVVILTAPVEGQILPAGTPFSITGTVSDNRYIKEIHIEISNAETAEEYAHIHIHPASANYSISHPLTPVAGVSYFIRLLADDPSTNTAAKSVTVRSE